MLLDTLKYIADKLNKENILWAVGASVLLNSYGLVECPNDIDIIVDIKDIKKVDELLKGLGTKKSREGMETYATRYFYEYVINDVDIDVMAGFIINFPGGRFEYIFDEKSITDVRSINGVDIPYTSLEDWYVIYQLIPNREARVEIIEKYLICNGIRNMDILCRVLTDNLPSEVRNRVQKMIIHSC